MQYKRKAAIADRLCLVLTWQHHAAIYQPDGRKVIRKIAERNFLTCYFVVIAICCKDGKGIVLYSF